MAAYANLFLPFPPLLAHSQPKCGRSLLQPDVPPPLHRAFPSWWTSLGPPSPSPSSENRSDPNHFPKSYSYMYCWHPHSHSSATGRRPPPLQSRRRSHLRSTTRRRPNGLRSTSWPRRWEPAGRYWRQPIRSWSQHFLYRSLMARRSLFRRRRHRGWGRRNRRSTASGQGWGSSRRVVNRLAVRSVLYWSLGPLMLE